MKAAEALCSAPLCFLVHLRRFTSELRVLTGVEPQDVVKLDTCTGLF